MNIKTFVTTDKEKWLFPQDVKEIMPLTFKKAEQKQSKDGLTSFPALMFSGEDSEKIWISAWKINLDSVAKKYGEETESWTDKLMNLKKIEGKLILEPMEL